MPNYDIRQHQAIQFTFQPLAHQSRVMRPSHLLRKIFGPRNQRHQKAGPSGLMGRQGPNEKQQLKESVGMLQNARIEVILNFLASKHLMCAVLWFQEHHVSNFSNAQSKRFCMERPWSSNTPMRHRANNVLTHRSPPMPRLKLCKRSGLMTKGLSPPGMPRRGDGTPRLKGEGRFSLSKQLRDSQAAVMSHHSLIPGSEMRETYLVKQWWISEGAY